MNNNLENPTIFTPSLSSQMIQQKQYQYKTKSLYHSLLKHFKSKHNFGKVIYASLLIIVIILILVIISTLYTLLNTLITINHLSAKLTQVTDDLDLLKKGKKLLSAKMLKTALKIASLGIKNKKINEIDSILSHEIIHIKYKKSPYYHHFREVLSQSLLLRGIDDIGQLYGWFPSGGYLTTDIIMELIYRGSRDGDDVLTFHSKCDDKQANIVLIKTKVNKEHDVSYLVGGFSTVPITSQNRKSIWIDTGLTYMFSLDSHVKYRNEKLFNQLIHSHPKILSYDNGIILYDKFLNIENGVLLDVPNHLQGNEKLRPFIGVFYQVEDVEVFRVYVNKK